MTGNIKWLAVLRDVAIIWILTMLAGFVIGFSNTEEADLMMGYDGIDLENKNDISNVNDILSHNSVKLTPNVRACVERVGKNLFRTKTANVLWKIDLKNTDNGQSVPYLVRVESVEATEEDPTKKEAL